MEGSQGSAFSDGIIPFHSLTLVRQVHQARALRGIKHCASDIPPNTLRRVPRLTGRILHLFPQFSYLAVSSSDLKPSS